MPERVVGSFVLWSGERMLAVLERFPENFTGMGSRVSPPVRLGSSFLNMADTIPDRLGGGGGGMGALRANAFFASHSSSKWALHKQFLGWEFGFVRE